MDKDKIIKKTSSASFAFFVVIILGVAINFVLSYVNSAPSLFNRPKKPLCTTYYDKNYMDAFENKEFGYKIKFPESDWNMLNVNRNENRYTFVEGPIARLSCIGYDYNRSDPGDPRESNFSKSFYIAYKKNLITNEGDPELFAKEQGWTGTLVGKYAVNGYPALLYSAKSGGESPNMSFEYRIFKGKDLVLIGYGMNFKNDSQVILDNLNVMISNFSFVSSTP
jgi:hypothetical protein